MGGLLFFMDSQLTAGQTMLNCIDNSGAAIVECAMVVGQKRHASIGTFRPSTGPTIPANPSLLVRCVNRLSPLSQATG